MAELIPVALLERLKEMEPVCLEHGGVPYCVIKVGAEVSAFVAICTHKKLAMFPPKLKKGLLVCPHHKVSFDPVTGEVVNDRGKTVNDLSPVNVEIVDGIALLETRKRHRKLVSKSERRWVEKENRKLEKMREDNE
ncbi:MAG: Rieske 2Fe-2S domain-containing protein [Acidobacteria bacterium]|nr:Rieske 2Fe-2S domain-containing protein [Acidobacteriota bacterium]